MNKVGRYLWLALAVAVMVTIVVVKKDALRDTPRLLLDSFLKRPLISQIIIGFVVWLILVIVPWFIYSHLVEWPEGEGQGLVSLARLFFFSIVWPPAWPIAVIMLLVYGIMRVLSF